MTCPPQNIPIVTTSLQSLQAIIGKHKHERTAAMSVNYVQEEVQ